MQWEIILDHLKFSVELAEITKTRQIQDMVGSRVTRIYTYMYVHIERDRFIFHVFSKQWFFTYIIRLHLCLHISKFSFLNIQ